MRRIINHVNSKPEHIRELVAGICTLVIGLAVVAVWFHSFKTTTYALLNPPTERTLAEGSSDSIFAQIGNAFGDLKGQISGLFGTKPVIEENTPAVQEESEPYPLPLSN